MKRMLFTLLMSLWLAPAAFAQDIYLGPKPETLFTAPTEQAFMSEFFGKFNASYDAPAQYAKALTTGVDDWEMALYNARKTQTDFYKNYPKADELSAGFKHYIEASIRWNYWHLLLAYPIVRGNTQTAQLSVISLPPVMLDGFTEAAANDATALPAEAYRNFLHYYVTYFNSKGRNFAKYGQTDGPMSLPDKAAFARNHLTGKVFQYALTRLMLESCDKTSPASAKTLFNELSQTPESAGYAAVVKERCGEVMNRKEEPKPAVAATKKPRKIDPNAVSFMTEAGEPATLDDYKGKVVYLDVWASWCGPCRAEFPASKELHERLNAKYKDKVVFLYISIDDGETAWKNALNTLKLPGEQGWAPGAQKNKLLQWFGIQGIPRYVLIDRKGVVANPDAKRPSSGDAIFQDIITLIGE